MNEREILTQLKETITGDPIIVERELNIYDAVRVAADGGAVLKTTAPTRVAAGIQFDDGETATLKLVIPEDYDAGRDMLALVLLEVPSADAAHTTDLGVTTAQSLYRAGAAVDTDTITAVAEDATASTDQLVRENVLDLSGNGYQGGDVVLLTLDANNSGTTELILLGGKMRYGSDIVAYDKTKRSDVDS